VVAARGVNRGDSAVASVTEQDVTIEEVGHGVACHDDVVAVAGPVSADGNNLALMGADDDLGVDAAAVVLADGGDRPIVHRDEGAVDDPRVVAVVWCGLQNIGQYRPPGDG
jgi:hypothetical protein